MLATSHTIFVYVDSITIVFIYTKQYIKIQDLVKLRALVHIPVFNCQKKSYFSSAQIVLPYNITIRMLSSNVREFVEKQKSKMSTEY